MLEDRGEGSMKYQESIAKYITKAVQVSKKIADTLDKLYDIEKELRIEKFYTNKQGVQIKDFKGIYKAGRFSESE